MNYLSICSGIEAASCAWRWLGWEPLGFSEIEKFPCSVLAHHYPNVPNLGDLTKITEDDLKRISNGRSIDLIVGGGLPARMSQSQENAQAFMESVLDLPLSILDSSIQPVLAGSSGRTSQASYRQIKALTSESSSTRLMTQGTALHGECLMLRASESPSDAVECFLSDILETGGQLQRYYLSPRACQGILNRANRRQRILPAQLKEALEAQSRE